jgi:hypothetical protein
VEVSAPQGVVVSVRPVPQNANASAAVAAIMSDLGETPAPVPAGLVEVVVQLPDHTVKDVMQSSSADGGGPQLGARVAVTGGGELRAASN